MPFWRVPADWPGETVFILGGGPSLATQNVERLRGRRVIAINSSYQVAPWASVLIFGDARWYGRHAGLLKDFAGEIVTVAPLNVPKVLRLTKKPGSGLSTDPTQAMFRRTSFASAINVALLRGARTLVFLGCDGKATPDGRTHHHAPHPWPRKADSWPEHRKDFASLVQPLKSMGVVVWNASPGTAYADLWPVTTLDEFLAQEQQPMKKAVSRQRRVQNLPQRAAPRRNPRNWQHQPVFLIGGGPSAAAVDLSALRGRGIVVAVNDSFRAMPWADVAFTADGVWLRRRAAELQSFAGAVVAAMPPGYRAPPIDVVTVPRTTGYNSGRGALEYVLCQGAMHIALIGYDLNGPGHWHAGYDWTCRFGEKDYQSWAEEFASMRLPPGAAVVNLNPDSAIRCFPFLSMDAFLAAAPSRIKVWNGIWLPVDEMHLIEYMTKSDRRTSLRPSYQATKIERALSKIKMFRHAVDVGAHVGLWTLHFARRFAQVTAFEPVALHRDCFSRNINGTGNVVLHPCALGRDSASLTIGASTPGNTGETLLAGTPGDIAVRRLDDFALDDVDLIKLDCEGYEHFAVEGALETIRRCRPVIVVEQHAPHMRRHGLAPKATVGLLASLGYRVTDVMVDDHIMVPG